MGFILGQIKPSGFTSYGGWGGAIGGEDAKKREKVQEERYAQGTEKQRWGTDKDEDGERRRQGGGYRGGARRGETDDRPLGPKPGAGQRAF